MTSEMDAYRYQDVTCQDCGVTYRCTPTNDHYQRASDGKMVCEPCLLGYTPRQSRALQRVYQERSEESEARDGLGDPGSPAEEAPAAAEEAR